MKRIEVIVSPKGESRIETFGFVGRACRLATRLLERALGIQQSDQVKPEYFENQTTHLEQPESE